MQLNASFFWTLASFVGLLILLARFTLKPVRQLLDKREADLRKALDEAEQCRLTAEQSAQRSDERIAQARRESEQIIAEGHRIVERMARDVEARAREDAKAIVTAAREEIARESEKAISDLRGTVSNLSIRISRQVVRGSVDDELHDKLVNDFIEQLRASDGID